MGWTGRIGAVAAMAALALVLASATGHAGQWCDTPNALPLVSEPEVEPRPEVWGALCAIAAESGEPLVVRFSDDGGPALVWSRSPAQHEIAQRMMAPFPGEVIRTVFFPGDPVDRLGTFILDPPSQAYRHPRVVSAAKAAESATPIQNLPLTYLSGAALTLIVLAGAVYWRPRIGLRAYAGIVALSLGGGGLFLSLMTDFLRGGYPGFGRQQFAGMVLGLLLVAVGAIALGGQAKRLSTA